MNFAAIVVTIPPDAPAFVRISYMILAIIAHLVLAVIFYFMIYDFLRDKWATRNDKQIDQRKIKENKLIKEDSVRSQLEPAEEREDERTRYFRELKEEREARINQQGRCK